jgi:hypothetical protein
MKAVNIKGATRDLAKPRDWDEGRDGPCGSLPVRDGMAGPIPTMASAWLPSKAELEMLNVGHPVILTVHGMTHPAVSIGVGTSADVAE